LKSASPCIRATRYLVVTTAIAGAFFGPGTNCRTDTRAAEPPAAEPLDAGQIIARQSDFQHALQLLSTDLAAEELRLSDLERLEIARIKSEYEIRFRAWEKKVIYISDAERERKTASGEMARLDAELDEPAERHLGGLLSVEQARRLCRLSLQCAGPHFFVTACTGVSADEFRLTKEQTASIERIVADYMDASGKFLTQFGLDQPRLVTPDTDRQDEEFRRVDYDLKRRAVKKIAGLLTPEQLNKFATMRGPEVDVERIDREMHVVAFGRAEPLPNPAIPAAGPATTLTPLPATP